MASHNISIGLKPSAVHYYSRRAAICCVNPIRARVLLWDTSRAKIDDCDSVLFDRSRVFFPHSRCSRCSPCCRASAFLIAQSPTHMRPSADGFGAAVAHCGLLLRFLLRRREWKQAISPEINRVPMACCCARFIDCEDAEFFHSCGCKTFFSLSVALFIFVNFIHNLFYSKSHSDQPLYRLTCTRETSRNFIKLL